MYLGRRPSWWKHDAMFYAVIILSIPNVTGRGRCPEGKWGGKCDLDCHCKVGDCAPDDGTCASDLCNFGWGARNCSVPCKQGTYGINCLRLCHCMPSVKCNRVNGACSGACHPDWGGPSCSFNLPRLNQRPSVKQRGCGILTVTWPEWNKENVVTSSGGGPIRFYNLMTNLNGTWSRFLAVYHVDGSVKHSVVTTLNLGTVAIFRVDVNRLESATSNDKKFYMGPTGLPTDAMNITCVVPPNSTTDKTPATTNETTTVATGAKSNNSLIIALGSAIPVAVLLSIAISCLIAKVYRKKSQQENDKDTASIMMSRHPSVISQMNENEQVGNRPPSLHVNYPLPHSSEVSLQQLSKASAHSYQSGSIYSLTEPPKINLSVTVVSKKKRRKRSNASLADSSITSHRSKRSSSKLNDDALASVRSRERGKKRER